MIELQDIIRQHGDAYRETHSLTKEQIKALDAILKCRTAALGAHIEQCDECEFAQISYNSCRNRHCPKCQTFAKEEWINKQMQSLIDRKYFHVVFTVPAALRMVFLQNKKTLYNILFKAASETLLELCADSKFLGAKPGITAVLHTWGQNLSYHPHLHCIVTGGGLTELGKWKNSRKKFFLPIKVLSRKFRGKFLHHLKRASLKLFGGLSHLNDTASFTDFVNKMYNTEWVVYCKTPFGNAEKVINYLGRYTHRVAISNNRIAALKDGIVTFRWRDYREENKQKSMSIDADEFIRRFLLHILPDGLRKIRHFGILASRGKKKRIDLCKRLTRTKLKYESETTMERLIRILGESFNLCPDCNSGRMSRASP